MSKTPLSPRRQRTGSRPSNGTRATKGSAYVDLLAWLWLGGVMLGYGLQFKPYIAPILNLVGLR